MAFNDFLPVLVQALPVLVQALPVLVQVVPVLVQALPVLVQALPVLVQANNQVLLSLYSLLTSYRGDKTLIREKR